MKDIQSSALPFWWVFLSDNFKTFKWKITHNHNIDKDIKINMPSFSIWSRDGWEKGWNWSPECSLKEMNLYPLSSKWATQTYSISITWELRNANSPALLCKQWVRNPGMELRSLFFNKSWRLLKFEGHWHITLHVFQTCTSLYLLLVSL